MNAAELVKGEFVYSRIGYDAGRKYMVMDTEPWTKMRWGGRDRRAQRWQGNGVACAHPTYKGNWNPVVVPLNQLITEEEYDRRTVLAVAAQKGRDELALARKEDEKRMTEAFMRGLAPLMTELKRLGVKHVRDSDSRWNNSLDIEFSKTFHVKLLLKQSGHGLEIRASDPRAIEFLVRAVHDRAQVEVA